MKADELIFNEANHTYIYKDVILPSVTQIMRPLSDAIYSHIDPEILRFAANRGTIVHFATELYDQFGAIDIDEKYLPYLMAYIKWKQDFNVEILQAEMKSCHEVLLYAGTIDRIAIINGRRLLIDLKTTSVEHELLVSVQCSAYREMLTSNGEIVDGIGALWLKDDGTYTFKELTDNFDIFLALFKIHNFKKKIKG